MFCIHCNSAALHTPITMHAFSKQHMQVLQTQRKSNASKRRMHSSGRNVLNIQLRLLISIPILPPFLVGVWRVWVCMSPILKIKKNIYNLCNLNIMKAHWNLNLINLFDFELTAFFPNSLVYRPPRYSYS